MAKNFKRQCNLFPKNVLIALLFFIAAVTALNSEKQRMSLKVLGAQVQVKAELEAIFKWEQITQERPDYRDGWIWLAVSYYQSGGKEKALWALQKAKEIDPNNETLSYIEGLWSN